MQKEVKDKTPLSALLSHLTSQGLLEDMVSRELRAARPIPSSRPFVKYTKQFRNGKQACGARMLSQSLRAPLKHNSTNLVTSGVPAPPGSAERKGVGKGSRKPFIC